MANDTILDSLRNIANEAPFNGPNMFVFLSGSRARGDNTECSDYDIIFWEISEDKIVLFFDKVRENISNPNLVEYHYCFREKECYNSLKK